MLKAYFTYVTAGLSIGFVNLSSGNPDVFSWDFGDGTTSVNKNPTVLFSDAGQYSVTLQVTNSISGLSDAITLSVSVSDLGARAPYTIFEAIYLRIPENLLPTGDAIDSMIKKWQLTLAQLVDPNIPEEVMYNELEWPPLVNELILNLVMYDMVTDAIVKMSYAASAASTGGSQSQSQSSTNGGLKAVETGPARAEFYDNATSSSQSVSYLAKSFQAGGGKDFQGQLGARICLLAARLRIPLEICPPLSRPVFAPTINQ